MCCFYICLNVCSVYTSLPKLYSIYFGIFSIFCFLYTFCSTMLFFDFIYLIFLTFCFFKPLYVFISSLVLSFLYIALLTPPNVYPYYGFCTCRSFSSHHHFSCGSKGRFVGCRKMLSIRRECIWRGLLPTRSSAQPQTSKFRLWLNSQNAATNGDLPLYVFFFISVSMCVCACMWRVEGRVLTSMCVFF